MCLLIFSKVCIILSRFMLDPEPIPGNTAYVGIQGIMHILQSTHQRVFGRYDESYVHKRRKKKPFA